MQPVTAHILRKSTQLRLSFIYNQIENHKEYHPVIIYTDEPDNDGSGFAQLDLKKYQYYYSGKNRNFYWKMVFRFFKQISKRESDGIIRFIQEQHVKVLHLHFGTDASIFSRVMRLSGVPSVVSFYGYDCSSFPRRFMGLGKRLLQHKVFKVASRLIAMSPDMKADLMTLKCPGEKVKIHYYGTDVRKYYAEPRFSNSTKKIKILTAGRLDEKKGHLFLLKALAQIKMEKTINFEWIIAGDGNQYKVIADEIVNSNLSQEIRMIGAYHYNADTLKELFADADIYIQPSITAKDGDKEGIPGTLIEAMSAGLPVISTNHAGIPSVLQNGITGILVNEWDIESMKKAIHMLQSDASLRSKLGFQAQQFALETLDLRKKEIELEQLYTDLIH